MAGARGRARDSRRRRSVDRFSGLLQPPRAQHPIERALVSDADFHVWRLAHRPDRAGVGAGLARPRRRSRRCRQPAGVVDPRVPSCSSTGSGHLAGSVYWDRWLPGATSAPLLLVASLLLARATWEEAATFRPGRRPGPTSRRRAALGGRPSRVASRAPGSHRRPGQLRNGAKLRVAALPTWMCGSRRFAAGATVGKRWLGLRVSRHDNGRLGVMQAL